MSVKRIGVTTNTANMSTLLETFQAQGWAFETCRPEPNQSFHVTFVREWTNSEIVAEMAKEWYVPVVDWRLAQYGEGNPKRFPHLKGISVPECYDRLLHNVPDEVPSATPAELYACFKALMEVREQAFQSGSADYVWLPDGAWQCVLEATASFA